MVYVGRQTVGGRKGWGRRKDEHKNRKVFCKKKRKNSMMPAIGLFAIVLVT